MSPGLVLVIVSSAALLLAVVLVAVPPGDEQRPIVRGASEPGRVARITVGLGSGAAVVALSGWLLPAVVVGVAAAAFVAAVQRRERRGASEVERTDALASWIENLRDVLVAGDQPIGAIAATVSTCPPAIRGHVRRLSTALGHQDPEVAFRRFADDLDDPLGDLVAVGLLVSVRRGARTVGVLSALADQARAQADRRRILEAERAPIRREITLLTVIMAGLLLGVLLFGRADYLSAYDTAGGQLFLAIVIGLYALLLMRVQRLARFPRPGRFLSTSSVSPVPAEIGGAR